ncbi:hypothetical protein DY000_02041397 [Brassica cretica]|uniref:Uncharacterized protein n=1 Tax=Brassica cretica TaxID=69181 RepID=A0ABQ7BDY5_BRACR|nr:hypothetical protein DY000_02041397 [Brassica cretica]
MTSLYQNLQWPPVGAPTNIRQEEPWRSQFNDPVNAVSFGFIATAILITMFIVMAIFEMLIRATTTNSHSSPGQVLSDLESRVGLNGLAFSKFGCESPKANINFCDLQLGVYSKGVSVLMPGDNVPTFIAHHAPVPVPALADKKSNTPSSSSNSIQEC